MNTLQHTLVSLLYSDEVDFKEEIPYILLPDAIRRYLGSRQYSHYEEGEDRTDVSWLKYPDKENINNLDKTNAQDLEKHIVEGIRPCVLGEETKLDEFYKHNVHLTGEYRAGVRHHLVEDRMFDKFIRETIDCSKKYDDEFKFNSQKLNGQEVRKLIADIETHGVYVLAYKLYQEKGIITNQQWFDENIKTRMDEVYSQDLSEGTYAYMKIPEKINEYITKCDWTHLEEGPIPLEKYETMYDKIEWEIKNATWLDNINEFNENPSDLIKRRIIKQGIPEEIYLRSGVKEYIENLINNYNNSYQSRQNKALDRTHEVINKTSIDVMDEIISKLEIKKNESTGNVTIIDGTHSEDRIYSIDFPVGSGEPTAYYHAVTINPSGKIVNEYDTPIYDTISFQVISEQESRNEVYISETDLSETDREYKIKEKELAPIKKKGFKEWIKELVDKFKDKGER